MRPKSTLTAILCALLVGTLSGVGPIFAESDTPSGSDSASIAGAPYRVRPVGDSITAGYGMIGGYRAFLVGDTMQKSPVLMLGHQYDNSAWWMIQNGQQYHDGFSGARILWLQPIVKQSLNADVVLLHIGTNDIRAMVMDKNDPRTPSQKADALAANLKQLLVDLLMADRRTKVLVAQIVPIYEDGAEALVREYNSRIPGVVAQFGSWGRTIRIVDMHSGMQPWDFVDGVHPNFPGYEKMADRWKAAINALPR